MLKLLLTGLLIITALPALAVFKCESNGQVTYSDTACANARVVGTAQPVTIGKPSATDIQEAQQRAAAEKKQLEQIEKKRDAQQTREQRGAISHRKNADTKLGKCRVLEQQIQWANEDAAAASGATAEKQKRKARRLTEKYQLTCNAAK